MKRMFFIVLSLLCVGSFIWGGGQGNQTDNSAAVMDNGRELIGNTYTTGLPIIKNPETFKIAFAKANSDKSNNFMEKEIFKKAERETGMKINFIEISETIQDERTSIMLAADPPDAFCFMLRDIQMVQNTGLFVNLMENDMMKKYAPHIYSNIEEIPDGWNMLRFPDGAVYSMPSAFEVNYDNDGQGIHVIRKDWLDKLGLKMPTTLDEYVNVLKAFRDRDPNGNGIKDEIPVGFREGPFSQWIGHILSYSGPWGMAADRSSKPFYWFRIENKKVIPVLNEKRYRDFLAFYHMLIEERLLDPEGFSQTVSQYTAKRVGDIYGNLTVWDISTYIPQIWAVVPPISAPGYKYVATGYNNSYQGKNNGFVIMKVSKNPTAVLRWWDYLGSSTEMKYLMRYGPEGGLWERDSSGQVWSIYPEETDPNFTRENKKYTWGAFNNTPIILKREMEKNNPDKYPLAVSRAKMVDVIKDYFPKEMVPFRFVPLETSRQRILIENEINAYLETFVSNAVLHGVGLDDAGWNNHLKQLEMINYPAWLKWYQDLIDGNLLK
jgi:ABC-type glycerol-3-phosphate transport system substrate-binding protein